MDVIDAQNIAILTEWANRYGYEFHTHKNGAFEHDVYNCYLRKPNMPNDKCVKAFLYGSEFEAIEAASKWLYYAYKKIKSFPKLIQKGV